MATVTAMTAARMLAIEAESITGARVDAATFHLILTRHDGTEIDAGDIQGPVGPMNPNAADLSDVNPQTFAGAITVNGAITSNEIFQAAAGANNVFLRPVPNSNNGALQGNSVGVWQTYSGAGAVRNVLDDGAGNMSIVGNLTVGNGTVGTPAGNFLIGAGPAGGDIIFRPHGVGDATNQSFIDPSGNLTLGGGYLTLQGVAGSSYIQSNGNSVTFLDAAGHSFLGAYDNGAGGGTNLYTIRGGAVGNMLDDGSGHIRATAQIYPGSEGLAGQTSGGFLHAAGVPANANGNNNDWCISDNGHLYFKAAGAWVQKI